jgi:hypothetical protein
MHPLEIKAIDHVVLRVKDLEAALAFYRDAGASDRATTRYRTRATARRRFASIWCPSQARSGS